MEWISVEERLPQKTEQVLVSVTFGPYEDDDPPLPAEQRYFVGHYMRGWKVVNEIDGTLLDESCITHWMPLPPPPATTTQEGGRG